jgi:site-specific DNA recombinase
LLAQRKVRGVLALCWDRISRNPHDDAIIKNLVARGVDVRFVQASYDKTSAGALHMDVDGMFAAHHSRVTSEKVRGTYGKLRSEGKCTYHSPIGYIDGGSDNKYFDHERAPLIRQLFELYATESWSIQQLAVWAKQHGLTTKPRRRCRSREQILEGIDSPHAPSSRPVSRNGIATILGNPFYIGYIRHRGAWLPGMQQPLIDQDLFYQVQRLLKKRTTGAYSTHRDHPFQLHRDRRFRGIVTAGAWAFRSEATQGLGCR